MGHRSRRDFLKATAAACAAAVVTDNATASVSKPGDLVQLSL
jgi:hypothetical protein